MLDLGGIGLRRMPQLRERVVLELVTLAQRLIDIPSITGEEGAMAATCVELLRQLGFEKAE